MVTFEICTTSLNGFLSLNPLQVQNYLDYIQGEYETLADGLFANNPELFPADLFTIENLIWAFGMSSGRQKRRHT